MDLLKQFHLARVSFEKKFLGLPYPYITLIHRLLLMIDGKMAYQGAAKDSL